MTSHRLHFTQHDPLRRDAAPGLPIAPERIIVDWTPAERTALRAAITTTLATAEQEGWTPPGDTAALQAYLAEHAAHLDATAPVTLRIPTDLADTALALAGLPLFAFPGHPLRESATPTLAQAVDHLAARMNRLHTMPNAFQLTLTPEDPNRPREGRSESPTISITLTVHQARQTLRFLEETESYGILSSEHGSVADEFRHHLVANLLATDDPDAEDVEMLLAERKPTDRLILRCIPTYAAQLGHVLETLWHVARHELWNPEDRTAVTGCLDAVLDSVEAATGMLPPMTQTRRALAAREDRAAMIAAGILTPDPTDIIITLPLTWPEAMAMHMLNVQGDGTHHPIPLFGSRIKARFADSAAMALHGMQSGKGLQSAFATGTPETDDAPHGFLGTSTAAAELHTLLPDATTGVLDYAWQQDAKRRWTLTLLAPEAWVVIAAASPQQPTLSPLATTTKLLQIGANSVRRRLLAELGKTPGAVADRRLLAHADASRSEDVTLAALSFGHHRGSAHPVAQAAWALLDNPRFNPLSHAVTPDSASELASLVPNDLPTGAAVNVTPALAETWGWQPTNQQLIATTLLAEKAPDLAKLLDPDHIGGLRSATLFTHDGQFVLMVYLAFPYHPTHPDGEDDEEQEGDTGAVFHGVTLAEMEEETAQRDARDSWRGRATDDNDEEDDLGTDVTNAFAHEAFFEAALDGLPMDSRMSEASAHELADTWGDVLRELEAVESLAFSTDTELGVSYVQILLVPPTVDPDAPMTAAAAVEATSHLLAAAAQTVHQDLHARWVDQPATATTDGPRGTR